jgi:hypothetical protein
VIELTGKLGDVNTAADPGRVTPREGDWQHQFKDGTAEYTFPPYSFSILRLE